MSNFEWKNCYWGDIATLEYGKSCRTYADNIGAYPVYGTNGQIGKYTEPLCQHSGVIIGRKGAYRGVHYSDQPFWVIDTAFYLQPKLNIDIKWAYYNLLTQDINGMDSGSAIPSTSRQDFYALPLYLPPLPEQKAIAHILGTLDDKIELNQQMNQTLEAIARAIFKSWFVDFDPVRAKMEGKQPVGMDTATANLFPDSFEESDLGLIPKGWKVGTVGDIAENPRRSVKPDNITPDTPYIGLEHMPRGNITLSEWGTADDINSNKYEFYQGEILFGKLRPYFHKVGVAPLNGICSTDILVINPKSSEWFSFALSTVSTDDFINYTDITSTGTRMPRTNWKDMSMYEIVIPSVQIAQAFNQHVLKFINKIHSNIFESRSLANIRDTLLPKLMSGEIRVKEAETMIEKVV